MNTGGTWFRDTVGWSGALLATAIALPILAVTAWLLRALLVSVAVLLVAAFAVACCSSSRFRCWMTGVRREEVTDHPMAT